MPTETETKTASAVVIFDPINAELEQLEQLNKSLVFNYRDPKDNKNARSHVYKLRTKKADVERARTAATKAIKGTADGLVKRLEDMIQVHQIPLDQIEAEEKAKAAEEARKKAEAERIERERVEAERQEALRVAEEARLKAEREAAALRAEVEAMKAKQAAPVPVPAPAPAPVEQAQPAFMKYRDAQPTPQPRPVPAPVQVNRVSVTTTPATPAPVVPPAPGAITLAAIKARGVHILSAIHPGAIEDQVREAIIKMNGLLGLAKDLKQMLDEALTEYIEVRGDLTIGTTKYYLGSDSSTKPRSRAKVLEAVLELAEGDVEKACELLSSDCFKHGSIKAVLNDEARYIELFEVTKATDPKAKKLKVVNTDFTKKKA